MRIAIDGPVAAGKTSTAKRIAEDLGIAYVDTGAMFRTIALYCQKNDIDISDVKPYLKEIKNNVGAVVRDGKMVTWMSGLEGEGSCCGRVTNYVPDAMLRTPEISMSASLLSRDEGIREAVSFMEKTIVLTTDDFVMEGRDIGSVVLPDADVKFYMDAAVFIRAYRRLLDLRAQGKTDSEIAVLEALMQRDKQDMEREIAPLKRMPDAIYIENTNLSFEETVAMMESIIQMRTA